MTSCLYADAHGTRFRLQIIEFCEALDLLRVSDSFISKRTKVYKPVEFIGDLNAFLKENLRYPTMAAEEGIQGTVEIGFLVKPDGCIGQSSIDIKSRLIGLGIDAEAIHVVKRTSGKWKPAMIGDEAVKWNVFRRSTLFFIKQRTWFYSAWLANERRARTFSS